MGIISWFINQLTYITGGPHPVILCCLMDLERLWKIHYWPPSIGGHWSIDIHCMMNDDRTSCADVPSLEMATLRNAACHGEMSFEWKKNGFGSQGITVDTKLIPWISMDIYGYLWSSCLGLIHEYILNIHDTKFNLSSMYLFRFFDRLFYRHHIRHLGPGEHGGWRPSLCQCQGRIPTATLALGPPDVTRRDPKTKNKKHKITGIGTSFF